MKYLVDKATKEHRVLPTDVGWSPELWSVVEADSDGWIAHTGSECPLPLDCIAEFEAIDGEIYKQSAGAMVFGAKNGHLHITRYRPILAEKAQEPEQPQKNMPDLVVTRDGIECADQKAALLEFKMQCLEASERGKRLAEREAERKHMEIKEAELKRMMLLDRLKAAHKAAQQIPDLEAELREVLGSMGYDLVARSPFVEPLGAEFEAALMSNLSDIYDDDRDEPEPAVETPQDMSDWRNWREGDLVECINDDHAPQLCFGDVLSLIGVYKESELIQVELSTFSYRTYDPVRFRFHSRPAKGER